MDHSTSADRCWSDSLLLSWIWDKMQGLCLKLGGKLQKDWSWSIKVQFYPNPSRSRALRERIRQRSVRQWELKDTEKWLLARYLFCNRAPSGALPLAISQDPSGRNSSAQSRFGGYSSSSLLWSSRPRPGAEERTELPATLVSERRSNHLSLPLKFCGHLLILLIVAQNSILDCFVSNFSSFESAAELMLFSLCFC